MSENHKVLYLDVERCLACKSCEIACAVAHSESKNIFQAIFEKTKPRVHVVCANGKAVPIQCRHCEKSPCVDVCPTKAIQKINGIVVLNDQKCIGCKMCLLVCPFGAMTFDWDKGVAVKCDLCDGDPECVKACPTNALRFETLENILSDVRKKVAKAVVSSLEG
jgi:carbon-monoxide dehydrogenase iron sulfur subunit